MEVEMMVVVVVVAGLNAHVYQVLEEHPLVIFVDLYVRMRKGFYRGDFSSFVRVS